MSFLVFSKYILFLPRTSGKWCNFTHIFNMGWLKPPSSKLTRHHFLIGNTSSFMVHFPARHVSLPQGTWYPKHPFLMDVWWNNNFSCNDLESSSWNNHKKTGCLEFQVDVFSIIEWNIGLFAFGILPFSLRFGSRDHPPLDWDLAKEVRAFCVEEIAGLTSRAYENTWVFIK